VRLAVIGDSYVFGKGVPEVEGLLDRRLEAALSAGAPGRRFEVQNLGYPGWGHFTYVAVARRALARYRPRAIVIGTLGLSDYDLLDYQQQLELVGPLGLRLLGALGAAEDLKELSLLYSVDLGRHPPGDGTVAGEKRLAAELEALLAEADASGAEVILWDYYEPMEFFRRFEAHPRFHRLGWPEGFPRGWDGWGMDPRLAIPVDRHPTGAANALVASHLAPALLSLLDAGAAERANAEAGR
jgi:hypothetical protein